MHTGSSRAVAQRCATLLGGAGLTDEGSGILSLGVEHKHIPPRKKSHSHTQYLINSIEGGEALGFISLCNKYWDLGFKAADMASHFIHFRLISIIHNHVQHI